MTLVTTDLPRAADSVRRARRLLEAHTAHLSPQQRHDAGLLVSELVSNALRHGAGAITLRIRPGAGDLWVEVADEGHGSVTLNPEPGEAGGWGLRIVARIADGWGMREGSTHVWFRMITVARTPSLG